MFDSHKVVATTLLVMLCSACSGTESNPYMEDVPDLPGSQNDMGMASDLGDMSGDQTEEMTADMAADMAVDMLEDMTPDLQDMEMQSPQWVGTPQSPDLVPKSDGFKCGVYTCQRGQFCQSGGFVPVCVDTPTDNRRISQCDDVDDCLSGVCCNTGYLTCETSCPANDRVCEDDQGCDGGYCCPRRLGTYPHGARNQCQPTPCETCLFEPETLCWQVTFGEVSLVGQDATDGRFFDVDFSRADLSKVTLKGSALSGIFSNAVFDQADLSGVRFFNLDGKKTMIVSSSFIGAKMDGANMTEVDASGSHFKDSTWGAGTWTRAIADDASFEGTVWKQGAISHSSMSRSVWRNARLEKVYTTGTSFDGAIFDGARLDGVFFTGSLIGASFKGADLSGSNLQIAMLGNNDWQDAVCPDGTNAADHNQTCEGHLKP